MKMRKDNEEKLVIKTKMDMIMNLAGGNAFLQNNLTGARWDWLQKSLFE